MPTLSNKEKRNLASQLFVTGDLSPREIADNLKVNINTISRWRKADHWDENKAAKTTGTDNLVRALLLQNQKIMDLAKEEDRTMTSKESDIVLKNAQSIKLLSKEVNLITVISVFKKYNLYLFELDPGLAKSNTEFQKKFIHYIAQGDE